MDQTVNELASWLPALNLVLMSLVGAVIILVIGWWLSIWAGRTVRRVATRSSRIDPTIVPMAHTVTVWAIRIIVFTVVLARLGVQTASIITVLGAAGLAIGLALQGTLQNIAAGIMLLVLRPLRTGEYVNVVGKAEGTVEEVGLFLSRFRQPDGIYITLPNNLVWGNPIVNFSRNSTRRLNFMVGVSYETDAQKAIDVLHGVIAAHPLALKEPAAQVVVTEYGATTVTLTVRVWTRASDYGVLGNDLHQQSLVALQQAGVSLTATPIVSIAPADHA